MYIQPILDHSELSGYIEECISNISYKEGAAVDLFQSANTDEGPKTTKKIKIDELATEVT